jgi:protein-L-isoaspartate O-methyltransferase
MRTGLAIAALLFAGHAFSQEALAPVPFITTPDEVVQRMLEMAGTRPQDLVIDLGSGDGRIVIASAQKFGARAVGIELDAALVEKSRELARQAGVADRVSFLQGDVLEADLSQATVVTVYLLPGLISQLQPRFLEQLRPGTRIVSHSFRMTGWAPDRSETVRISKPHPGQGDLSTLYMWIVPAEARGRWRAAGSELIIHQDYQRIEVEGRLGGRALQAPRAGLNGREIVLEDGAMRFRGRVQGDQIAGELVAADRRLPLSLTRSR